jgi:hydrogenase maturation protease
VVQQIEDRYDLPPGVEAVDGGTLGLKLLSVIEHADRLLVVDAIKNKGEPGDLYRFSFEEIPYALRQKNSLHQTDLMEALTVVELIGTRPETVIVGVEPADISPWGVELTPPVAASLDRLEAMVLEELKKWSIELRPRQSTETPAEAPLEWTPKA